MGIIARFTDVMGANINALLTKAEEKNADVLLQKYLQDAKENLGQVKAETAAVIAEEMACGRKLSETEELYVKYEGYAATAVKAGNDADARKFLEYNVDLMAKKAEYAKKYELAKGNSEKMRQMTVKLVGDIEAAAEKLESLQQRLNVAKSQEKLNTLTEKLGDDQLGNFDNLFDVVQKRIDAAEATSELNKITNTDSIEDLAKKYEPETGSSAKAATVEEQLAKLKAGI
ncbi:MAG: PspA/IM30 family protein [Clostridia bacterium]